LLIIHIFLIVFSRITHAHAQYTIIVHFDVIHFYTQNCYKS